MLEISLISPIVFFLFLKNNSFPCFTIQILNQATRTLNLYSHIFQYFILPNTPQSPIKSLSPSLLPVIMTEDIVWNCIYTHTWIHCSESFLHLPIKYMNISRKEIFNNDILSQNSIFWNYKWNLLPAALQSDSPKVLLPIY